MRKVWLVEHPTYRYNEDVKDLARRNNLKVVCPLVRKRLGYGDIAPEFLANNAPELTLKPKYAPEKPKPKRGRKPKAESSEEE